ncbi:MAG: helix-turn-helix transcriptional regulator [Ruminococcaceae bacterium]|nr:helix-turn-helix transcriptional regulator [Oscillospiraceae bacterium]
MITRLRDLREDRDLSQKEIATMLKIHQTTYSDYELGNLNIPIEVLITLARFYKTSTDYILKITDNPIPYTDVK